MPGYQTGIKPEGGALRNIIFLFIEESSSSSQSHLSGKKLNYSVLFLNIVEYLSGSELAEKTGLLSWASMIGA